VQPPVHFELVGVSMANQYRLNPLESVRIVPRLVFALFSIAVAADGGWLEELGLDEETGDAPLPEPPDELLPHAASRTASIANAAGSHLR
jgi:hypothetical protein